MSHIEASRKRGKTVQYAVLIVDDDRHTAESLANQLDLLGHTAVTTSGPRMAMKLLDEVIPDVIFMDMNMPGVNGLEVVRFLRRDPLTAAVPVIMTSVNDTAETIQTALEAGVNHYLVKPLMVEDVEAALTTVMDNP